MEARDTKLEGNQVLSEDHKPLDPQITDHVVCMLDSVDLKAFTLHSSNVCKFDSVDLKAFTLYTLYT